MSKKLAVVISGAVSLGSFEAGVIYEVLEAIARHNESLSENDENRIEIDVITGASAGGMTACILAQNLLYDDGSLRKPFDNSLYKAWVEEVDIVPLLKIKDIKDQKKSLLEKKVVEDIAAKYLLDKEKRDGQKHSAASSEIQIGVAMSNLNGFNYQVKTSQNQTFGYTRFKDQFVCSVRREENGDAVLKEKKLEDDTWEDSNSRDIKWSDLREAGISSGAFPLAFPMRSIFRVGEGKFSNRDSKNKNDENPDSVHKGNYLYTDGGVFENEPVGMARALVDHNKDEKDNVTRYYLLVKPGERKPSEDPFLNQEENLLTTAIALFGAIFQQAQFQDWIMKEIDSPLLTITSNDSELIGDVFSAFSGFLEEKFRAYDYNIGRERAREQLKEAHRRGLLSFDPNEQGKMPAIAWNVHPDKSVIGGQKLTQWEDVKSKLGELAKEIKDEKTGKRNQLEELHRLMHEVKKETREEIRKQLKQRLSSLIDFINDKYITPLDEANSSGINSFFKLNKIVRQNLGQPLTRDFLVALLDVWLEAHIVNPPEFMPIKELR